MSDKIIYPIGDAHCDYLYHAVYSHYALKVPCPNQSVTLKRLVEGGVAMQFFAVWIDTHIRVNPLQQCLSMISRFYSELDECKNMIYHYSPEMYNSHNQGVGAVLTMEGLGEAMRGELSNLDIFARLGVKAATLTWNYENDLAYPATTSKPKLRARGLKQLGKEVIKRMNELKIAVDVSHLNDQGIDDVLELSIKPPFASHSNARGAYNALRSMKDEHIKEIARRGGVIGINFYHAQLTDKTTASIDDVIRQIDYIAGLVGCECISIGSDYDGMDKTPVGLEHPGKFQALAEALIKRGYTEEQTKAILFDNLKNYIDSYYQ